MDQYIFLGDYCVGLAYPNKVMDYIRSIGSSYVVSGNEDELLMNLAYLEPDKWPKGQFEAGPWIYKNLSERNRRYLCGLPQEIKIKSDNRPPIFIFHKPQRYSSDPFFTMCYADDPLSWGDKDQTRELYEQMFRFYDEK